jgi:hypothetical protein
MGRLRIELTAKDIQQIETLSGYGLTLEQCAAVLDIHEQTLQKRRAEDPEIDQAIARGRGRAQGAIGQSLYQRAQGGDVQAIKWWEATRAGRFASLAVVHQGDKDRPVKVKVTVTPHGDE